MKTLESIILVLSLFISCTQFSFANTESAVKFDSICVSKRPAYHDIDYHFTQDSIKVFSEGIDLSKEFGINEGLCNLFDSLCRIPIEIKGIKQREIDEDVLVTFIIKYFKNGILSDSLNFDWAIDGPFASDQSLNLIYTLDTISRSYTKKIEFYLYQRNFTQRHTVSYYEKLRSKTITYEEEYMHLIACKHPYKELALYALFFAQCMYMDSMPDLSIDMQTWMNKYGIEKNKAMHNLRFIDDPVCIECVNRRLDYPLRVEDGM